MAIDVLAPSPLTLHVRSVRPSDGYTQPLYELHCCAISRNSTTTTVHTLRSSLASSVGGGTGPTPDHEWTLWKSFDEFHAFDVQMRVRTSSFAKMMVTVAFAPEHRVRAFFHRDQSNAFFEKRRKELDYYMQRILMLSDVSDFLGGNGSSVLAEFIAAHDNLPGLAPTPAPTQDHRTASGRLRQLHVSPQHASCSPRSAGGLDTSTSSQSRGSRRRQYKQEIEDALLTRCSERERKSFKKRANAFRKENDSLLAATEFVTFLNAQFDRELAQWLLTRFYRSLRNEEHRAALMAAGGLREEEQTARQSRKMRRNSTELTASSTSVGSRRSYHATTTSTSARASLNDSKPSRKELLARVYELAEGDAERVAAFKRAAKALGNEELSAVDFVTFLHDTFGDRNAQQLLAMTVDVAPSRRLEMQLRQAARP